MFGSLKGNEIMTGVLLSACVIAVAAIGVQLSNGDQRVIVDAMIKTMIVVGIFVFAGNSGVQSFGHVSFAGIGAYTAAWLTIPPSIKVSLLPGLPAFLAAAEVHPFLGLVAGGMAAAAVATVFGMPLSRLSGIAASIGTFALLMICYSIFANWSSVTGGQASLYGLPKFTTVPVAAVFLVVAILGAAVYQASPFGRRLRASREDVVAARSSGIDVRRERLIAFVFSALLVGMAGALYAYFLQMVIASEYYLRLTFITIAMLTIGGQRSLSGAVVGAGFVALLTELLRQTERGFDFGPVSFSGLAGLQEVGLALVMLGSLILRPEGLLSGREIRWPRILKTKGARTN